MSSNQEYDYFFKLLMIGFSSVGKNSILTRFVENVLDGNYVQTIDADYVQLIFNIIFI